MGIFDGQRRADLRQHHLLVVEFHFRCRFATEVTLAYLGGAVSDI